MAFIQSAGQVTQITQPWQPWHTGIMRSTVRFYDNYNLDYAAIYRTQPNVRTVVEFLARNIAQLRLHVFRRVSDVDRRRLTDYAMAQIIKNPMPARFKVTEYRFMESIVSDLAVYNNAYLLKIRSENQMSLLRIPPFYVTPHGGLVPTYYELNFLSPPNNRIESNDIIHFKGYNPENPIGGLSELETLRRILAEEHAAGGYREGFWNSAARKSGIIIRPAGAPDWSDNARERFKQEWLELYSGTSNSGKTAILEEGMSWVESQFNARESEYLEGRKLTREECARAYHIPPPLVGILDHATFSNIEEQHKQLYQDTLGPWLVSIAQDFDLQLLPEFPDSEGVYSEFNIAEKLRGSFEEQTKSFQAAVGRPWMTPNEARARLNMPQLAGDANALGTPLNVLIGGQASPLDSVPKALASGHKAARRGINSHDENMRKVWESKWVEVLAKHYHRQGRNILSNIPAAVGKSDIGGLWWDDNRWNSELKTDLLKLNLATASAWADRAADMLDSEYSQDIMLPYLDKHSEIQSIYINERTRAAISGALKETDPQESARAIFETAATTWALTEAVSAVTSMASFGTSEASRAAGLRSKTWQVNSQDPRELHAAMNGETVDIRETFSNGQRWPGDPAGGADNNANCQCSVNFST